MGDFASIIDAFRGRLSELERRLGSISRTGVVTEVDAANGVARVKLTGGNQPLVTGWIPWEEASAGANKTHNPPSVGQQVRINSETGDLYDAIIQGSLNSDANGRPSGAGDEHILASVGEATVALRSGGAEIVMSVGGVTLTLTSAGLAVDGGSITHNGKSIDDSHTHSGVSIGPYDTGTPN